MNLTSALYDWLSSDATLCAMLAIYAGGPAIFTTDPAPGNATLPYIVSAGHVADVPWDTKLSLGREVTRDVRCYAAADGSAAAIEAIAERVRELLHRSEMEVDGHTVVVADCAGPVQADEQDAYGRILTVRLLIQED